MYLCRQSTIRNDMQVRSPMLIPLHTIKPPCLYCDFSRTNIVLFRRTLSLDTKIRRISKCRLNWYTSLFSNNVACYLDVQQSIFFQPHGAQLNAEIFGLRAYNPLIWNLLRINWLNWTLLDLLPKEQLSFVWRSLLNISQKKELPVTKYSLSAAMTELFSFF